MGTEALHLIVPSGLDAVSEAGSRISSFLRAGGVDDLTSFQIELAAVEVISNVVRHGLPSSQHVPISVDVEISDTAVRTMIQDPGLPPPMPPVARGEDPLAEGGRGIEIIYAVMDEVEHRVRREGNVIELTKRLVAARKTSEVKS